MKYVINIHKRFIVKIIIKRVYHLLVLKNIYRLIKLGINTQKLIMTTEKDAEYESIT